MPEIIEIKARSEQNDQIHERLIQEGARFVGEDHQVDTYFNVAHGRLKLREGQIENNLIHYHRPNQAGPKHSSVLLYRSPAGPDLKAVLSAALGIKVVVDKVRRIYFIDNVKFHLDQVKALGQFVEIEAIAEHGERSLPELEAQCYHYLQLLNIEKKDRVSVSYSDLLLKEKHP